MAKKLNKNLAAAAAFFLQCPSFGIVLYRNSTKGGALAFKIQLVGGAGYSRQKRLTLRDRLRYLTVTHAAPNPVLFYAVISNFLVLRVRAE